MPSKLPNSLLPACRGGGTPPLQADIEFMQRALTAARGGGFRSRNQALCDVPVGAVWTDCRMSFVACNLKEATSDPTAHAEILVLRHAAEALGRWRLGGTLYVTLEPCAMCAGAILEARLDRLVFGAWDPKAGACGSVYNVMEERKIRHRITVVGGVCAEASASLLKDFFRRRRKGNVYGEMAELG